MHLLSRAVVVLLVVSPLVFARPQWNDISRRTDGEASDMQTSDASDAADAVAEAATDTAIDNMFMDLNGDAPPGQSTQRKAELNRRAEIVKQAFLHSWGSYKVKGLPQDELHPVSGTPYSTRNGWGASAVDALGTAIVMDLKEPVNDIVKHVKTVNFSKSNTPQAVSLFETTIRYMGGMLSAYDLLREPKRQGMVEPADIEILLKQSTALANSLSVAFNTPSGIPYNDINANLTGPSIASFNMEAETANIAQAGTLTLEWSRLSDLTGNATYRNLARRAQTYLMAPKTWGPEQLSTEQRDVVEPFPGLVGFDIFIKNGTFKNGWGTWAGGADSYYEYLIKMWMYDSSPENLIYRDRWIKAVNSSRLNLRSHPVPQKHKPHSFPWPTPPTLLSQIPAELERLSRPDPPEVAFMSGWRADRSLTNFSQHLTCFDGGNILLGAQVLNENALRNASGLSKDFLASLGLRRSNVWPDFVRFALELVEGCHHLYTTTSTQIGTEVFSWWWREKSNQVAPYYKIEKPPAYVLRPEVMESYYYAYRITGQAKYQDWAWDAFLAIEKYCKAQYGYSAIRDVNMLVPGGGDGEVERKAREGNLADEQESFWFAETLKYAYLIQQDGDEPWHVARGLRRRTEKNHYVFNTEAHPLKVQGRAL